MAPEVGLGDTEEASSLEDRWAGGQKDFFSRPVPPWAEGPEEGQGCLSRRQCDLLWAGQGTGRGRDRALWLHSLLPPRPLLSQEAEEGQTGQGEEAEQEKGHTLCP